MVMPANRVRTIAAGGQLRIELRGPHGRILSGLVIGEDGPELAEWAAKQGHPF